jgi:hypothetical protein
MIRRTIVVAAAFAAAACMSSPDRTGATRAYDGIDTQGIPREGAFTRPPYPQDSNLMEFSVGPAVSHRYFIDTQSVSVGTDGIVRYTVVIRAAGGATNVFFEGIRCDPAQKRIYAFGRAGGQWIEAKRADWTPIHLHRLEDYQTTLYADGFCPERSIVRSREEALFALRSRFRGPASSR